MDAAGSNIAIMNGNPYGLSSGVRTNFLDDITRFARERDVGTANIWEVPRYRIELIPFGGVKDSRLGYKEGVQEAMKSFTNVKTLTLSLSASACLATFARVKRAMNLSSRLPGIIVVIRTIREGN